MAITRMQQPRQLYGLGSFVKKVTRKITKPVTKVAQKIVPKELAGIMRTVAPFLPPGYREAAYLLGTAKQTGRISPVDLAIVLAPQVGKMKVGGGEQTISQRLGALDVPFTEKSLGEVFVGAPAGESTFTEVARSPVQQTAAQISESGLDIFTPGKEATSGLFGKGGEFFQFGKEGGPGIFDTKAGRALFGKEKPDGTFGPSFAKLAGFGTAAVSAVTAADTPEEAGNALVEQTGNSDDYERGVELFSRLNPELFRVPEQFRLPAQAGGLMRENYALGTMPTAKESGLGGLPIEADMRYTGGFMPYGAKEKADDVPARLSKNEFVFTADAVRAAGGGSVQKGAQRMYNTMKQLESKPEAKGMTA